MAAALPRWVLTLHGRSWCAMGACGSGGGVLGLQQGLQLLRQAHDCGQLMGILPAAQLLVGNGCLRRAIALHTQERKEVCRVQEAFENGCRLPRRLPGMVRHWARSYSHLERLQPQCNSCKCILHAASYCGWPSSRSAAGQVVGPGLPRQSWRAGPANSEAATYQRLNTKIKRRHVWIGEQPPAGRSRPSRGWRSLSPRRSLCVDEVLIAVNPVRHRITAKTNATPPCFT